jgi:hypothetical protein
MAVSLKAGRVSLTASSFLLVAVALVIALLVIPAARADAFPGAAPERAVPAFWVNVALQLAASAVFLIEGITTRGRTLLSMIGLTVLGIVVLLLGLALTDAAAAYLGHGPPMHVTAILLFAASAATCVSALIAISVAYVIPKKA